MAARQLYVPPNRRAQGTKVSSVDRNTFSRGFVLPPPKIKRRRPELRAPRRIPDEPIPVATTLLQPVHQKQPPKWSIFWSQYACALAQIHLRCSAATGLVRSFIFPWPPAMTLKIRTLVASVRRRLRVADGKRDMKPILRLRDALRALPKGSGRRRLLIRAWHAILASSMFSGCPGPGDSHEAFCAWMHQDAYSSIYAIVEADTLGAPHALSRAESTLSVGVAHVATARLRRFLDSLPETPPTN